MVESAYQTLIQQSQRATAALVRQGKLLNVPNTGLAMGKQVVEFARQHPQAALVAVNAIRQESSLTYPLPLKAALIMAILGLRSQLNDHYLQHLTGATFTLLSAASYHRDTQILHFEPTVLAGLKKHLGGPQLALWRSVFAVGKLLAQPNFHRYLANPAINYPQWWLICCSHLSIRFSFSFYAALRPLALSGNVRYEATLRQWLTYPGDIWPGAQAPTESGKHTVMYKTDSQYGVLPSSIAQTPAIEWKTDIALRPSHYIRFNKWAELTAKTHQAAQQIAAFKFEGRRYPVSHPPRSIITIIDMLQDSELDIGRLAAELEQEPAFADALKHSATLDNRLQLPVKEVKQAVLTYGTERVGDMLVLEALMQRLTQHYFPLGACCKNLLVTSATLASLIAAQVPSRLSAQSAALVSTFSLAPVFTLPALKILARFPHNAQRLFDVNALLSLKTGEEFVAYAAELAANWHQPKIHQAIIRQFGKMPAQASPGLQKEFAVISLSLLLSRKWLFVSGQLDEASIEALRQCLHILKLKPEFIAHLQAQVSSSLYTPITHRL